MKATTISYCQVCHQDFKNKETVYYIPNDNNIVCVGCADKANTEAQPRIFEQ